MLTADDGSKIPESWIRKPMQEEDDILLHLFLLWDKNRTISHWQIVMKHGLESLLLDKRISLEAYKEIDELVRSGKVMERDSILYAHKSKLQVKLEERKRKSAPPVPARKKVRPTFKGLL